MAGSILANIILRYLSWLFLSIEFSDGIEKFLKKHITFAKLLYIFLFKFKSTSELIENYKCIINFYEYKHYRPLKYAPIARQIYERELTRRRVDIIFINK